MESELTPPQETKQPPLRGIGNEINNYKGEEGFPWDIKFYRTTGLSHLKVGSKLITACESLERHLKVDRTNTSTPIELVAVRQTEIACSLLAQRLGLSPEEIVKNFTPQPGETPGQTLARLIEWQEEMMEKISLQK